MDCSFLGSVFSAEMFGGDQGTTGDEVSMSLELFELHE